jgi:hypothetical protein
MFKNKQELLKLKHLLSNRVSSSVAITANKINEAMGLKSMGVLLPLFTRTVEVCGLRLRKTKVVIIIRFLLRLKKLYNTRGMKGLVNYLKAAQVLFQQSLGGMRLRDTSELKCRVSRNQSGVPRIVDSSLRLRIRREDVRVMKFVMTLLALYRTLEFPGTLKLKTITDGFKGDYKDPLYGRIIAWIPLFAKMIKVLAKERNVKHLADRGITPRAIVKSAPGTGPGGISTDPQTLLLTASGLKQTGLASSVEFFIKFFEKGTDVPFPGLMSVFQGLAAVPVHLMPSLRVHTLGRLGFKDEPAGKVRAFAMCDAWTQWVLEPFHEWLFDLLRGIPTDGTFDQLKPVKAKATGASCAYSLDLSAATDRLPMSIQIELVKHLVNKDFAIEWARLLVSRGYGAFTKKYGGVSEVLHYAVGQPMGALSSWAMLATTHHLLVQLSAWEAGVTRPGEWFTNYAVLGDDLVIFDYRVKRQYVNIVDVLGVECNLAKSLLSSKGIVVEFAKRTFYKGMDISPIPITEMLAAHYYLPDAIAFARKYNLTFPSLIRFLGYGRIVRANLQVHIGKLNSRVRALLFAFHMPVDEAELQTLLSRGNPFMTLDLYKQAIDSFKDYMKEKYSERIAAKLKAYPATPTVIKAVVDTAVSKLLSRLRYVSFLQTVVGMGTGPMETAVSTQVEPLVLDFDWTTFRMKWNTKGFRIPDEEKLPTLIKVEPSMYNQVENFVRNLNLSLTRIVKLLVSRPMSDFRAKASKLNYTIHAITYKRTPLDAWKGVITSLRSISLLGSGVVHFERALEKPIRHGVDAQALQLYREFSAVLLRVITQVRERKQNKKDNAKSTPKS